MPPDIGIYPSRRVLVYIDESQFPANARRELIRSLRTGRVNHKFHYQSFNQAEKWLALHEAWSPARNDPSCIRTYAKSFREAAAKISARKVHVIGLGCGGGQKDSALLRQLAARGKQVAYTPVDVSEPMVLVAQETARRIERRVRIRTPLVCDLATARNLSQTLNTDVPAGATRLLTFFGMLPNFEPAVLGRIAAALGRNDLLLLSANLAPGDDYTAGVKRVRPQYDNELTREWLLTFLLDLGIERRDGTLETVVEPSPQRSELLRLAVYFRFQKPRSILLEKENFRFKRGQRLRLFFSYRYTVEKVETLLAESNVKLLQYWLVPSGEEGIFLCRKG